jgi:nitrogen fixation NifU-like protein
VSDLRELYQDTILDHSRHPKNFGKLEGATHHAEGYNPLCGDRVEVFVTLEGERVADIHFVGQGCAISTASASLMTEAVKGKTLAAALELFENVHRVVTGKAEDAASGEGAERELGKLAVLEGVKQYPLRVKCATLAWHTMRNAVTGNSDEVAATE